LSENESFIDEVTEEVRRDKLYLFFKKYGWIAGLILLFIVLTSVFVEIRSNARINEAEKLGDFLTEILEKIEKGEIVTYDPSGEFFEKGSLISSLIETKLAGQGSDHERAKVSYEEILNNEKIPLIFKDFAKFKLLLLIKDDPQRVEKILDELIAPNNPFRVLAMEQKVLKKIKESNWEGAQTTLDLLKNDPSTSQALQSRASQIQNAITFGGS